MTLVLQNYANLHCTKVNDGPVSRFHYQYYYLLQCNTVQFGT